MLFKIIGEILHPIMFNGDKKAAETAAKDFNKYLEYDGLVALHLDKEKIYMISEKLTNVELIQKSVSPATRQKQKPKSYEDKNDNSYYFKNGMPHAGCALELFIARKVLDKKTRSMFPAKEFSFHQHSYAEICFVINNFLEKDILSLYPNTNPEDLVSYEEECEEMGVCGIKWSVVKRVEKDPKELGWACFDFDIEDEVKLRGVIDIGISEFMNDRRYDELGYLRDLSSLSSNELTYEQQKDLVLRDIKKRHAKRSSDKHK